MIYVRKQFDGKWKYSEGASAEITVVNSSWSDAPVITGITQTSAGTVQIDFTVGEETGSYCVYENSKLLKVVDTPTAILANVAEGDHTYMIYVRKKFDGKWKYSEGAEAKITVTAAFVVDYENYSITYDVLDDSTLVIVAYSGNADNVVIPESVEGKTVTKVGDRAFEGNTDLISIDLPDSITIIGVRAFAGCSKLSKMS